MPAEGQVLATRVPDETYEEIQKFLMERGITNSNLVRMAVRNYLAENGLTLPMEAFHLGSWGGNRRGGKEDIQSPELMPGAA